MASYSRTELSESIDGRGIKVVAIATAGTLIHEGPDDPSSFHEIWLYAVNSDGAARKLTLEWGGVSVPDDLIEVTVPAESGLMLLTPGLMIIGNATRLAVRAFADVTNVVVVHGYVNAVA